MFKKKSVVCKRLSSTARYGSKRAYETVSGNQITAPKLYYQPVEGHKRISFICNSFFLPLFICISQVVVKCDKSTRDCPP